jgi:deoxyribonuclease-4
MERLRVRHILSNMGSLATAELKKLLPSKLKVPENDPIKYPNALLTSFPKGEGYSLLGWVAEELLRLPQKDVTMDAVIAAAKKWYPDLSEEASTKIRNSKTTQPFIDHIIATRAKIELVANGELRYDEAVSANNVEGHPDARTDTQVFEVKMTGMLKENWQSFLYQVFAYGALAPETKDLYLVLPMQEIVWHYNLESWANRQAYAKLLQDTATKLQTNALQDFAVGSTIRDMYHIGHHTHKLKTLSETVRSLSDYSRPYQIFLGGPQNSKIHISDAELAEAAQTVSETGASIYVHSQYLINLCQKPGEKDDYHTALLIKNLQYANAAGFKGVVVHVGKYTDKPLPEALENMRKNLQTAIAHATETCPILLETPAGQGTETLQTYTEFVEFVLGFQDKRLRVCVDSCHVFACGYRPIDYVRRITTYNKKLLKLVHYNDSATPCGSHLDRHAFMGTGHVGMEEMARIAELCHAHTVPMVIE